MSVSADLTLQNFVSKIKALHERDWKKLRIEDLVHLIKQLHDDIASHNKVDDKINEMNAAIDFIKKQCLSNSNEINEIKSTNEILNEENSALKVNNSCCLRQNKKS